MFSSEHVNYKFCEEHQLGFEMKSVYFSVIFCAFELRFNQKRCVCFVDLFWLTTVSTDFLASVD